MSELKPCQYCDGLVIIKEVGLDLVYSTYCVDCKAIGPICKTRVEVMERHNHRPTEDALKAHAVEVLARTINDFNYKEGTPKESLDKWYEQDKHIYRAEARALLGWEE